MYALFDIAVIATAVGFTVMAAGIIARHYLKESRA